MENSRRAGRTREWFGSPPHKLVLLGWRDRKKYAVGTEEQIDRTDKDKDGKRRQIKGLKRDTKRIAHLAVCVLACFSFFLFYFYLSCIDLQYLSVLCTTPTRKIPWPFP